MPFKPSMLANFAYGTFGRSCVAAYRGLPSVARCSHVTSLRSSLFKTHTTSRGSVQRYWRRWTDPRLVVCVLNNEDLSEVTWEQRATEGNPRYAATQDLPNVPYAKFATMLGLKGIYVDDPKDLEAAWRDALTADRPVVLEVKTDANVPPLPPHITAAQIKAFMAAFMKGDRPLAAVMAKSLKRAIHETT